MWNLLAQVRGFDADWLFCHTQCFLALSPFRCSVSSELVTCTSDFLSFVYSLLFILNHNCSFHLQWYGHRSVHLASALHSSKRVTRPRSHCTRKKTLWCWLRAVRTLPLTAVCSIICVCEVLRVLCEWGLRSRKRCCFCFPLSPFSKQRNQLIQVRLRLHLSIHLVQLLFGDLPSF